MPGAIGIDRVPLPGVDVVHDLNSYPWPLAENSFDRVVCRHSLSHLHDLTQAMREIHRVSRPGGIVEIIAPHYTSDNYFSDPTHRTAFGYRTMNYFASNVPSEWDFYLPERFELLVRHISFRNHVLYPGDSQKWNPWRGVGLEYLVNLVPRVYERVFAFLLPASEVYFKLRVTKK